MTENLYTPLLHLRRKLLARVRYIGLVFLVLLAAPGFALTNVFFSEYIEGSSNNKALEIFNGTGSALNLATENYIIQIYFNGSATVGLTINLTGTVAPNDVYVVAQASANATILAQADQTNGAGWYNGDDAVVLRKGGASGTIIDVIGQIGTDPGTEWGSGLTSTADNTLRRKSGICLGDTDGTNGFDPSTEWDGYAGDTFDGLGAHTASCGNSGDTAPSVLSTVPVNNASGVALNGNITLTFSEAVTAAAASFTVEAPIGTSIPFTLSGGTTAYVLDPLVDLPAGTIVKVTVTASAVTDLDGTPTPMAADYSFNFATVAVNPCTVPTLISAIQGSGLTATLTGVRTIKGIVVKDFQNITGTTRLGGFYVQEEDLESDGNPATSEGIFVFEGNGTFLTDVSVGDQVCITGTVAEFASSSGGVSSSLTQMTNPAITVVSSGNSLPATTMVQLPVANVTDLERYEGMLVQMSAASGNLTVTEYFELGRFGQVVLSADGASNQAGTDARLDQYTQFNAPSTAGYTAYLVEIAKRQIILDDGISIQNPDPILFGRGGNPLSAFNTLRGGDQVGSIEGILDHRFEGYRIQTTTSPNFMTTNIRPATPPAVGGTIKIASFNVLNYFNGNGAGGGFPTARGATTLAEFTRQRDKIINAITASGADVIGLMEIENDGYDASSAIQDLVNGLNAVAGAGTYSFINPGNISTDEITVALIYKSANVTPAGAAAAIPLAYGSGSFVPVGRRSLAQTFQQSSTGETFTAVVNHFKSKGSSSGGAGDADAGDGQGLSNGTRTRQAEDLASWLSTHPTGISDPDYFIMGDLNAYTKEDPLTALANAGYSNLLPLTSYSYVFDGQVGSLDHGLGSASLATQVTGAEKWHLNADEPSVLDYNVEFKTAGLQTSLYSAEPFRASDHDPVLVGLNLCTPPSITNVAVTQPNCTIASGTVVVSATGVGTVEYSLNNTDWSTSATFSALAAGTYNVSVRNQANPGCATVYASNPIVINSAPNKPAVYTVSGGGGKCSGNNGNGKVPSFTITLSDSETGTAYQLQRDGIHVGSPVAGTGNAITFEQSVAGAYTVIATSADGCSLLMNGAAIILTDSRPETFFVTGGGNYCVGGAGVAVGMASTQTGVNYLLKRNNVFTGTTVAGTGGAVSFGNQVAGTYTVDAVHAVTGCDRNMNGSAVVLSKNCNARESFEIQTTEADTWALIAPNPVEKSRILVEMNGAAQQVVHWQLFNLQGQSLGKNHFTTQSSKHQQEINAGVLKQGTYLLQLESENRKTTLKVITKD